MTPRPKGPTAADGVVFRLLGITKRFGATEALRGVDLALAGGEFVALLGPNGAGKSTLFKVLDGVETPDGGSVEILHDGALGIVHQDLGLVDELTVAENLFFGDRCFWLRRGREARATAEVLDRVGIAHLDPQRLVSTLGLGERTIDTIDPDGVALAAIQALDEGDRRIWEELARKEAEIEALKAELGRVLALLESRNQDGR